MARNLLKMTLILLITFRLAGFAACSQTAKAQLDPDSPVTIECWHYYNGEQMVNFDKLIQTFNETIGTAQGIQVIATSQGNDHDLAVALQTAAAAKDDTLPDVFASYPGTAFELAEAGLLVDLSRYISADELARFQPDFLAEGRFATSKGSGLYILPIAKSSEVIALNMTAWRAFAAENPRFSDPVAALATWESLSQAAESYRSWSGGKAMIGFDSLANFLIIGSRQLGVDLMAAKDGKMLLDLDREALRQIWNIYYTGIVMGNIAEPGDYRADDIAAGDLIAGIVSTASGPWLPESVTTSDVSRPIELAVLAYPVFKGGEPVCVQQGAGLAVARSDSSREAAAAVLLDWLIRPEQNVSFAIASSYLPVTLQALESQLLRDNLQALESATAGNSVAAGKGTAMCLNTFLNQMQSSRLYCPAAFSGSGQIRDYLETSLAKAARDARQAWLGDQSANISLEKLQSDYINNSTFETWYSSVILNIDMILESD